MTGPGLFIQGSVACDNIYGKVLPLIEAFAHVQVLLPVLMLAKDFFNWLHFVGWVVRIRDVHIQNDISSPCVKATAHDVTPECTLLGEEGLVRYAEKDVLFHRVLLLCRLGGAGWRGWVDCGGWVAWWYLHGLHHLLFAT